MHPGIRPQDDCCSSRSLRGITPWIAAAVICANASPTKRGGADAGMVEPQEITVRNTVVDMASSRLRGRLLVGVRSVGHHRVMVGYGGMYVSAYLHMLLRYAFFRTQG
jgi:hypothetical protein